MQTSLDEAVVTLNPLKEVELEARKADLTARCDELEAKFKALGPRLQAAAEEVKQGRVPLDSTVFVEAEEYKREVVELAAAVAQLVADTTLSAPVPVPADVDGVRELLALAGTAYYTRRAVECLQRVLSLTCPSEPDLAELVRCRAEARTLDRQLRQGSEQPAQLARSLASGAHPLAQLLRLTEPAEIPIAELTALQASINTQFDAALAVAALAGRLEVGPAPAADGMLQPAAPLDLRPDETEARVGEPESGDGASSHSQVELAQDQPGLVQEGETRHRTPTPEAALNPASEPAAAELVQPASIPIVPKLTVDLIPSLAPIDAPGELACHALAMWASQWGTLDRAYLAARWLDVNAPPAPLAPDVLVLAHTAFAPEEYTPSDDGANEFYRAQRILDVDMIAARPGAENLWFVSAGLCLLKGIDEASAWFHNSILVDSASARCSRMVDALRDYYNTTGKPLPQLVRLLAADENPQQDEESRDDALETLRKMVTRRQKFPLGLRLMPVIERKVRWLEEVLEQPTAEGLQIVSEWLHDFDADKLLDEWAEEAWPNHPRGIEGDSRAALLRDLRSIRDALQRWLSSMNLHTAPDVPQSDSQALSVLRDTLRTEGQAWRAAGQDGHCLLLRLLVGALEGVFVSDVHVG